jgi:hypothetical protein
MTQRHLHYGTNPGTTEERKADIVRRIDEAWGDLRTRGKMNWLGLENIMRDILAMYRDADGGISRHSDVAAHDVATLMDEAMAAFTGRGGVLSANDWQRNRM